eukprot:5373860-Amphidinium_carterae.2
MATLSQKGTTLLQQQQETAKEEDKNKEKEKEKEKDQEKEPSTKVTGAIPPTLQDSPMDTTGAGSGDTKGVQ